MDRRRNEYMKKTDEETKCNTMLGDAASVIDGNRPRGEGRDAATEDNTQERVAGRFYKLSKTVHMVIRVCRAMKGYAELGIMDYDSLILGKGCDDEGLVFDVDRYRRRQQFRLPSIYHESAQKPLSMRTSSDISQLHKMMRSLQCFRKFDSTTQREICRCLRYERYTKNRVIVRQGHLPQAVYFIFSGTVSERFNNGKPDEIRHYKRGDMFGVADIVFKQSRSSTVTCEDMVEVLVLYLKDIAHSSIMVDLKKATHERLALISRRSPLSVLSEDARRRLVSVSSTVTVNDDKFVGMEQLCVYLLYKGSCNMTRLCSSDEMTPKLKANLRKVEKARDGSVRLKTTDHWEEGELSDKQKLLRFLDAVDNNVSSRVSTSWSRKPEVNRQEPLQKCSSNRLIKGHNFYTTNPQMESRQTNCQEPHGEITGSQSNCQEQHSEITGSQSNYQEQHSEITGSQSRHSRYMCTPCSQENHTSHSSNPLRHDDCSPNSRNTASPFKGRYSNPEDLETNSTSDKKEPDIENSDKSSTVSSECASDDRSQRTISTPENKSRCNSGSRLLNSQSVSCLHFTVRHLKSGDIFGKIFQSKSEERVCFLSKSCTLLTIPLSVYLKETPQCVTSSVRLNLSKIPDTELLCSKYNKSLVWENFKTDFVESLRRTPSECSSRQSVQGYYSRSVSIPRANGPVSVNHKVNSSTPHLSYNRDSENRKRCARSRLKSNCFRPHSVFVDSTVTNRWTGDRYWVKSAPPRVTSTRSSPASTIYRRHNLSVCKLKSSLTGVTPLVQQLPSRI